MGLLTDTRDDTVDDELIAWPTVLQIHGIKTLGPHRPHPADEVMRSPRQSAQEAAEGTPEPNRWTEPRARIQALLAKAKGWEKWLAADPRNLGADIARREGVSRARISQILTLCKLAPQITGDLTRKDDFGPVPNERQLRELARIADPQAQVSRYREMGGMRPRVTESTAADPQASVGADPKANPLAQATRPKGLQHAFAEARRLQAILDAEPGLAVAELGRREGITGSRVSQILGLLQLPAAMVATLDVAPQEAPKVGTKQVRAIVGLA